MACIDQHYQHICEHKWDGPTYTSTDGCTSSATCSKCCELAISHDMRCGP
jgi:hypothetical protein